MAVHGKFWVLASICSTGLWCVDSGLLTTKGG